MKYWTSLKSLLLQKLSLIVGVQGLTLMMIQSVGAQETIVSQMAVGQMAVKAQRKNIRLLQFRLHGFQVLGADCTGLKADQKDAEAGQGVPGAAYADLKHAGAVEEDSSLEPSNLQ
ncbi:hypothetical protein E3N88_13784 [Mikania micrantha]|uniref:Uncharacterized protein n=1 Tax=Mikania micrantha TaxID=192012 RepID=A0A5N6NZK7_9ASTR|nr:hypothetical protein E3N88_13784 [Mikania micrantha]